MTGALAGMRVLESTQHLAGPSCAMFLADMGAEVIKIEQPGKGDASRILGKLQNGESPMYTALNRNKLSLTLNYKDPQAVQIFLQLAAQSDVIVENNRAGVMDRLGLGYEAVRAVNPQIIYASISGFGQTGPYRERGGYDTIAQGMSGIMSATGNAGAPPAKAGVPMVDIGSGLVHCLRHSVRLHSPPAHWRGTVPRHGAPRLRHCLFHLGSRGGVFRWCSAHAFWLHAPA